MQIVLDLPRPAGGRHRPGPARLFPVLLLLVSAAIACTQGGNDSLRVVPDPSGFAGRWLASETRTQNGCGFVDPVCISCPCPVLIEVVDAGDRVLIRIFDRTLTGRVNGGVITFADTRTSFDDGTCKVTYQTTWAGTRNESGVSGEWIMTLSPAGVCDPMYSCENRGTFTWTPCPVETCSAVICPMDQAWPGTSSR